VCYSRSPARAPFLNIGPVYIHCLMGSVLLILSQLSQPALKAPSLSSRQNRRQGLAPATPSPPSVGGGGMCTMLEARRRRRQGGGGGGWRHLGEGRPDLGGGRLHPLPPHRLRLPSSPIAAAPPRRLRSAMVAWGHAQIQRGRGRPCPDPAGAPLTCVAGRPGSVMVLDQLPSSGTLAWQ